MDLFSSLFQHTPTVDLSGTAFLVASADNLPGVVVDFGHTKFLNPYGLPLPKGTPNTLFLAAPLAGYHSHDPVFAKYWDSLAPGATVTVTLAGYSFNGDANTPLGCIQFDLVKPSPYPWQSFGLKSQVASDSWFPELPHNIRYGSQR